MPEHGGLALGTPADGVMVLLQLSTTDGGVGAVAFAGQATVDEPPGGNVKNGGLIVYVYVHCAVIIVTGSV